MLQYVWCVEVIKVESIIAPCFGKVFGSRCKSCFDIEEVCEGVFYL